jgi:hypothetical protein
MELLIILAAIWIAHSWFHGGKHGWRAMFRRLILPATAVRAVHLKLRGTPQQQHAALLKTRERLEQTKKVIDKKIELSQKILDAKKTKV